MPDRGAGSPWPDRTMKLAAMCHFLRLAALLLSCLPFPATLCAQTATPASVANAGREIVSAPAVVRPLRVAIYDGPGSGEKGVANVTRRLRQLPGAEVTRLRPEEVGTRDLSAFDLIVFSGGSGSAQAKAVGETGREAVRRFVAAGGGYLGVCAGAYLACAGYEWGIGLLDARTVSPKWRRGRAVVDMQFTEAGRTLFGDVEAPFQVRYANGPVIQPLGRDDLPDYTVLARFRSEVAENGTPAGVMVDSPAVVATTYGRVRVVTVSPHPEDTPGLEHLLSHAVLWLARTP